VRGTQYTPRPRICHWAASAKLSFGAPACNRLLGAPLSPSHGPDPERTACRAQSQRKAKPHEMKDERRTLSTAPMTAGKVRNLRIGRNHKHKACQGHKNKYDGAEEGHSAQDQQDLAPQRRSSGQCAV
jgi:hypothetical protein